MPSHAQFFNEPTFVLSLLLTEVLFLELYWSFLFVSSCLVFD